MIQLSSQASNFSISGMPLSSFIQVYSVELIFLSHEISTHDCSSPLLKFLLISHTLPALWRHPAMLRQSLLIRHCLSPIGRHSRAAGYATQAPGNKRPPNFLAFFAILGLGFGAFAFVSQQQASGTRKGNQFSKAGVTPTLEGMAEQAKQAQRKLAKGGPTPTFDPEKIVILCTSILLCPAMRTNRQSS